MIDTKPIKESFWDSWTMLWKHQNANPSDFTLFGKALEVKELTISIIDKLTEIENDSPEQKIDGGSNTVKIENPYAYGKCPKCGKGGNVFEFKTMSYNPSLYPYLCPECYDSLSEKVKGEANE